MTFRNRGTTKNINRSYIKNEVEKIYPVDKYSRILFPNLVPILTDLCINEINKVTEIPDHRNKTFDSLQEQVFGIVNLKNLLFNNPGTLLLVYKDLIQRYIAKKHRRKDSVEEIVQEIITRFMRDKIKGIKKRFDFNDPAMPTFTSYFMVTVRNIYIDIVRKEIRSINPVENEKDIETYSDNRGSEMLNSLILNEEFEKLNALINMFHKSGPKLRLSLKVKFNIPIEETDVKLCFPKCSENEKQLFISGDKILKSGKSMEKIVPVFNKYEGKSNNPDTLRKWLSVKLDEIKKHMNNTHPHSPYNNATISDLIILYFQREMERGN